MQLRTVKKPKSKAFDFGVQNRPEQLIQRKNSVKEQEDKEVLSSNENSNLTKENEIKGRHKLRNQSNNYQGKYKKMNSGKYLYKLNNAEKKPVISKKKQLRFLPFEVVNTFKRILTKLNKKEEETILNKKKKRDEGEEGEIKEKGDTEGIHENKKMMTTKLNNVNQFQQVGNINTYDMSQQYILKKNPYDMSQQYILKKNPYDLHYQQNLIENMKIQGYPVENQQLYYRMNKDFMRLINMPEYYYQGLLPQHVQYEQEPKPKSESIFNLISDKENLNRINKIANEGVNHIVAAFYIKSIQQSRNAVKTTDNSNIIKRASIPVNSVNLDEGEEKEENNSIKSSNNLQDVLNANHQNKQILTPRSKSFEKETFKNNTFDLNINNMMMFNDKYTPDINEFTANQLNTVNNVMKKLKENKISEIIENDYQSKKYI